MKERGGLLKAGSVFNIFGSFVRFFFGFTFMNFFSRAVLMNVIDKKDIWMYWCVFGIIALSALLELVAGIVGIMSCEEPQFAKKCIIWGVVILVLGTLGNVLEILARYEVIFIVWLTGTILPFIYLAGAILLHTGRRKSPFD